MEDTGENKFGGQTSGDQAKPASPNTSQPVVARAPLEPVGLDALVAAASPLVQGYFQHQQDMQKRDLSFQERMLKARMVRDRWLLIVGSSVISLILLMAGVLIFTAREDAAIQLITLVASLSAAAFGGYGYAVSRQSAKEKDEEW